MKVTPAHDAKDFEIGLKHNLKLKDILADDGTVTIVVGNFKVFLTIILLFILNMKL